MSREQALEWWNNLPDNGTKRGLAKKHLGNTGFSLTDREIEEIWNKEVLIKNCKSEGLKTF